MFCKVGDHMHKGQGTNTLQHAVFLVDDVWKIVQSV
jgi:hypothetical protein